MEQAWKPNETHRDEACMDGWVCRDIRGIRTAGSYKTYLVISNKIADTESVVRNQDVTRLVSTAVANLLSPVGTR